MVNLHDDTKDRFDSLQPEDSTQDEFVRELLNAYEQNGKGVDPEVWADPEPFTAEYNRAKTLERFDWTCWVDGRIV